MESSSGEVEELFLAVNSQRNISCGALMEAAREVGARPSVRLPQEE